MQSHQNRLKPQSCNNIHTCRPLCHWHRLCRCSRAVQPCAGGAGGRRRSEGKADVEQGWSWDGKRRGGGGAWGKGVEWVRRRRGGRAAPGKLESQHLCSVPMQISTEVSNAPRGMAHAGTKFAFVTVLPTSTCCTSLVPFISKNPLEICHV